MTKIYDAEWVTEFYDAYGEKEWERLAKSPSAEVQFAVHRHYLDLHVRAGEQVLEIGPGPGRFTDVLVARGAQVTAVDISPVQLELHRRHALEAGFDHGVVARHLRDMCDLSGISDEVFDHVVCYGGPLSYVFERQQDALQEMRRTLRPGGKLFLGVMSTWGSIHQHLPGVLTVPSSVNREITTTGDLTPDKGELASHRCHMFRSGELKACVEQADFAVEAISASSCLAPVWDEPLREIRELPEHWQELLRMEIEACASPGCWDMGTHIILVGSRI